MSNVNLGNLYDFNKGIIKQKPAFTDKVLDEQLKEIFIPYLHRMAYNRNENYFMLLCNEARDFTLFNILPEAFTKMTIDNMKEDLKETILNRGKVKDMSVNNQDALEFWIENKDDLFCYHFFPYSNGVIEVK